MYSAVSLSFHIKSCDYKAWNINILMLSMFLIYAMTFTSVKCANEKAPQGRQNFPEQKQININQNALAGL